MKKTMVSRYVLILVILLGSMLCSAYFSNFYYRGISTVTPYVVQVIAYMLIGILVGRGCSVHCTAKETLLRLGIALLMLVVILIPVIPLEKVQQMAVHIIETHSYIFFALGVGYIFSTLKSRE